MSENEIVTEIVDSCYHIHRELGSGLLESVYEEVLFDDLIERDFFVTRQQIVPIKFRGKIYEKAFRTDLIVENKVIVELKSVEKVMPVHKKTLLTYLKLTNLKLGLLINFNEVLIKDGIKRIVNQL